MRNNFYLSTFLVFNFILNNWILYSQNKYNSIDDLPVFFDKSLYNVGHVNEDSLLKIALILLDSNELNGFSGKMPKKIKLSDYQKIMQSINDPMEKSIFSLYYVPKEGDYWYNEMLPCSNDTFNILLNVILKNDIKLDAVSFVPSSMQQQKQEYVDRINFIFKSLIINNPSNSLFWNIYLCNLDNLYWFNCNSPIRDFMAPFRFQKELAQIALSYCPQDSGIILLNKLYFPDKSELPDTLCILGKSKDGLLKFEYSIYIPSFHRNWNTRWPMDLSKNQIKRVKQVYKLEYIKNYLLKFRKLI